MSFKKLLPILILIVVVLGAGAWWYFGSNNRAGDPAGLIMFVDRNIPPEQQARLTADIARMRSEIGDRLGDKKSMEDLERWIGIGSLSYVLGNLREARAALLEAADLNPANYVAWGNLGDVLTEMGDLPGARGAYQKAVELSNLSIYILKYADFLVAKFPSDPDEYERVLLGAVAARGQEQDFIARLADFYMEQERYAEAVSHYEVLVQITGGDVGVRRDLLDAQRKLAESQQTAN